MYDRPETRAANDALWHAIASHLTIKGVPERLSHEDDPWAHWRSEQLLLSQTCGMPYREKLHRSVHLVGAWQHPIECSPGQYFSVLIARADDPRSTLDDFARARLAYNDRLSQSGWAAPQNMALDRGWSFETCIESGAHRNSAKLVADGAADVAAIDAVTWAAMCRWDAMTTGLKAIATSPPTPALPLITAFPEHVEKLQNAIRAALGTLSPDQLDRLQINDFVTVEAADYLAVSSPEIT